MGGQVADLLVEEFGGLAEELVYGFPVALLRLFGSVIHFSGLFRSVTGRVAPHRFLAESPWTVNRCPWATKKGLSVVESCLPAPLGDNKV